MDPKGVSGNTERLGTERSCAHQGLWGRWGDAGQRVQIFSYKLSKGISCTA